MPEQNGHLLKKQEAMSKKTQLSHYIVLTFFLNNFKEEAGDLVIYYIH